MTDTGDRRLYPFVHDQTAIVELRGAALVLSNCCLHVFQRLKRRAIDTLNRFAEANNRVEMLL